MVNQRSRLDAACQEDGRIIHLSLHMGHCFRGMLVNQRVNITSYISDLMSLEVFWNYFELSSPIRKWHRYLSHYKLMGASCSVFPLPQVMANKIFFLIIGEQVTQVFWLFIFICLYLPEGVCWVFIIWQGWQVHFADVPLLMADTLHHVGCTKACTKWSAILNWLWTHQQCHRWNSAQGEGASTLLGRIGDRCHTVRECHGCYGNSLV